MLHMLQSGSFKMLTTLLFKIQNFWQLSLRELPSPLRPCFLWRFHTYQHCAVVLGLLQPVLFHCSICSSFADAALAPHLRFQTSYPFSAHFYLLSLHPHHHLMLLAVFLYLLFFLLPNCLRVLQWNAGGLQARSTKLVHFISSHPVDLIHIQESNLNLSSSFQIPGFSALRSDGTHSRSGIFSIDATDASGGVIIIFRQGLSFSELSTSSLSLLDPYSDYAKVNISANDSSSLSFLNAYAPPIRSSPKDSRTNFVSLSVLPSYVKAETVDFSRFRFHKKGPFPPKKDRFHFQLPLSHPS